MSNSSINSNNLKNLFSRFFEKDFEISEKVLELSYEFLFTDNKQPDVSENTELQSTLIYLKNVLERNNLKNLDDLMQYYERKRKKLYTLFEKLEETDPEECYALNFQQACTMYMKNVKEEHNFKSNCLYYLQSSIKNYAVEISLGVHHFRLINTPYSVVENELKKFISQLKEDLPIQQAQRCCVSKERINEMVSN